MRAVLLRTLLATLVALLGSRTLLAQGEIVDDLPVEYVDSDDWLAQFPPSDRDPRLPANVLAQHAEALEKGQHLAVLRALADALRAETWPRDNDLKQRFQQRLDALVAAFTEAQAAAARDGTLDDRATRDAIAARLSDDHAIGVQSLLPERVRDDGDFTLAFFSGTPGQIVTYRQTDDDRIELLVSRSTMLDLRLRAEAVRAVLQDFVEPVQARAHETVRAADRGWTNYLEHGYSQYPWEALVNGWLVDYDVFHPPRAQFILLHPSLGLEVPTASFDELRANEALELEVLGYVRYRGAEREHYLGGSFVLGLSDQEKPALGFVVHWDASFSLGIQWRDEDDDNHWLDDDPFLFLSVDLFRYAQGRLGAFQETYERVQRLL